MTAQKTSTQAGKPPGTTAIRTDDKKTWRRKTPVEIIVAQRDRLDEQVREKEAELGELKDQLSKFDEVLKVFQK